MKVKYHNEEIELDDSIVEGREEFDYDYNDIEDLEQTKEIKVNEIKNYQGDQNE